MVLDAYDHIKALTNGWHSTQAKQAARAAQLWAHSACTQHATIPNCSSMVIRITTHDMDHAIFSWAQEHLHTYLPTPTLHPTTNHHRHPSQEHTPSRTEEITLQLSAVAHSLIQSSIEFTDTNPQTPKELPETQLCFLLGLRGLRWDERPLLAPIWQNLH